MKDIRSMKVSHQQSTKILLWQTFWRPGPGADPEISFGGRGHEAPKAPSKSATDPAWADDHC